MKYFNIKTILALIFSVAVISGCYYDDYPAIGTIDRDVSFIADIVPIFNTNCNSAGCHSSGGITPALTAELAYDAITNGGFVNAENPESSTIYRAITGETTAMPPSGKMSDSDIGLVLAWIQQGALNN